MSCEHESCGTTEKIWLPYSFRERHCGLKPHLYCVKCGLIRNISSERPRNIGYYINVVAALKSEFKVTKIQMRLISQELERCCIEDTYGIDRYLQENLFIQIVRKYLNVPEQDIYKYLHNH